MSKYAIFPKKNFRTIFLNNLDHFVYIKNFFEKGLKMAAYPPLLKMLQNTKKAEGLTK